MHNLSLKELSSKLQSKEISSAELTDYFLQRIAEDASASSCFAALSSEQAKEIAGRVDGGVGRGALAGIPLAYQDSIVTQGVKTSAGSKMLENFIAPYDAQLVSQLKEVGMPTLGKTAMSEFSMGRGAGFGSTAQAVGKRLAPIALMLDSGQALVQECLAVGTLGFRPSYGAVSRYGLVAKASSFDQASIVAKSFEDVALLLEALVGKDAKDNTSEELAETNFSELLASFNATKKLGVVKQDSLEVAQDLGVDSVEVDLPLMDVVESVFQIIGSGEISSNLSRYDGVRFGYRCENPQDLEDMYSRSRSEGFGADVKKVLLMGTAVLTEEAYQDYYQQSQKIRRLIIDELDKAFEVCDFIALSVEEDGLNQGAMLAALAGLPLAYLPVSAGRGAVVLARRFADADLLGFANSLQTDG